jgi:superoxide dismutase, Fe-Mn family
MNESSISTSELQQALGSGHPPVLIDVRRAAVFQQATVLIKGATWQDPAAVDTWGATMPSSSAVIVYCVHGHEVSRNCASRLLALGVDARFLEGGIEAWGLDGGAMTNKP